MEQIEVSKLKTHPMNKFYFDDMAGDAWEAFLDSIKTSGVIEPVITTQDMVIVSGHQRVRACKELGITKVMTDMRYYQSEDQILKDLIETNIRQRGIGNTNPVKFGRCIAELERIYGIKNGGDRKSDGTKFQLKTQDDLADELGMTKRQLSKYKSLTDLIPELQDAVQSGQITATTAMGFVKKLSPEEQHRLAEQIADKEKVSQREIDFYTKRIKELSDENAALKNRQPEVREVEKVVAPKDYDNVKAENVTLRSDKKKLEADNAKLKAQIPDKHDTINFKADQAVEMFIMRTYSFLEDTAGFVWLTDQMDKISDEKLKEFRSAVNTIAAFGQKMMENIGGYAIE